MTFNISSFVDQIFNETHKVVLFQLGARVQRSNDIELKTINITEENPFIIIYARELEQSVPWWIFIVSITFGVLLLVLLTFGAYKCGFFKRPLKKAILDDADDTKLVNSLRNDSEELQ